MDLILAKEGYAYQLRHKPTLTAIMKEESGGEVL